MGRHSPDGSAYPNQFVWKEIVPPERIVWLYGISKDDPHAVPTTGSRRTLQTRERLRILRGAKVFPQTTHNMLTFHL